MESTVSQTCVAMWLIVKYCATNFFCWFDLSNNAAAEQISTGNLVLYGSTVQYSSYVTVMYPFVLARRYNGKLHTPATLIISGYIQLQPPPRTIPGVRNSNNNIFIYFIYCKLLLVLESTLDLLTSCTGVQYIAKYPASVTIYLLEWSRVRSTYIKQRCAQLCKVTFIE